MFNALRPEELLIGLGKVLRSAADAPGRLEDYQRSQLLSAFSVTRLLAAEQAAAHELEATTRQELEAALAGDERPAAREARRRIATADGIAMGEALVGLLAALPAEDPTRTRVHRALAAMADREVAVLARARD